MKKVAKQFVVGNSTIIIGPFTYGEEHLKLLEWGEGASLVIGNFCSIASDITIFLGGNHCIDWISTYPFGHVNLDDFGYTKLVGHPSSNGNVVIGNDVWIGRGSTIMSGIQIGDGAVIAANSHVVKNIQPYTVVGGNPAKIIKARFSEEIINLLLLLRWWDLDEKIIDSIKVKLQSSPDVQTLKMLTSLYR